MSCNNDLTTYSLCETVAATVVGTVLARLSHSSYNHRLIAIIFYDTASGTASAIQRNCF